MKLFLNARIMGSIKAYKKSILLVNNALIGMVCIPGILISINYYLKAVKYMYDNVTRITVTHIGMEFRCDSIKIYNLIFRFIIVLQHTLTPVLYTTTAC